MKKTCHVFCPSVWLARGRLELTTLPAKVPESETSEQKSVVLCGSDGIHSVNGGMSCVWRNLQNSSDHASFSQKSTGTSSAGMSMSIPENPKIQKISRCQPVSGSMSADVHSDCNIERGRHVGSWAVGSGFCCPPTLWTRRFVFFRGIDRGIGAARGGGGGMRTLRWSRPQVGGRS